MVGTEWKASVVYSRHKRRCRKSQKTKVKELKGATVKAAEYEEFSDKEKRNLYDLYKHSENQGYDLWDAVRHYDKFLATSSIDRIKVKEAVPLCLEAKEKEDGSSKRYMQSLRSVLNRFKFKCGKLVVDEVRHPQITEFVNGYYISLRTSLGYLTDLRSFFSWCELKGYCDVNPVVAAMPSKAKRKEIMNAKRGRRKLQVLTPTEGAYATNLLRARGTNADALRLPVRLGRPST